MAGEAQHRSYDYANRDGVRWLSWPEFAAMAAVLAERLQPLGVEAVVGIARAGLFPATAVACALRRDLYPARVTRREQDVVTHADPVWKTPVSPEVRGKVVAVVDEIADSGRTLALVAAAAREAGAAAVVTAVLVAHTWADPQPDVVALVSDELLVFPWDRRVLIDGVWRLHPEIAGALEAQGLAAEDAE
ncbi:MAG: phosphoribosyltransferase [Anaerolineae bacterium]